MFAAITDGLQRAIASDQWTKNHGQYIPLAATWLNCRRWKDEPTTAPLYHSYAMNRLVDLARAGERDEPKRSGVAGDVGDGGLSVSVGKRTWPGSKSLVSDAKKHPVCARQGGAGQSMPDLAVFPDDCVDRGSCRRIGPPEGKTTNYGPGLGRSRPNDPKRGTLPRLSR